MPHIVEKVIGGVIGGVIGVVIITSHDASQLLEVLAGKVVMDECSKRRGGVFKRRGGVYSSTEDGEQRNRLLEEDERTSVSISFKHFQLLECTIMQCIDDKVDD